MRKWIFSKNSKIIGPYNLSEADDFVRANPESYAWHPSYSHWMPVTCINEFQDAIPIPKPPSIIPKELIAEFVDEERKLIGRLVGLDKKLAATDNSLGELDTEIKNFQDITKNCTVEVRATLESIEQQFSVLSKNLSSFKMAVTNDKKELTYISKEFEVRLERDKQPKVDAPLENDTVKISTTLQTENKPSSDVEKSSNSLKTAKSMVEQKKELKTTKTKTKFNSNTSPVSNIEFNAHPSKEDVLLSSQVKMIDKPISATNVKQIKPIVGEFDHILYESLNNENQEGDLSSKKILRRRRRR